MIIVVAVVGGLVAIGLAVLALSILLVFRRNRSKSTARTRSEVMFSNPMYVDFEGPQGGEEGLYSEPGPGPADGAYEEFGFEQNPVSSSTAGVAGAVNPMGDFESDNAGYLDVAPNE